MAVLLLTQAGSLPSLVHGRLPGKEFPMCCESSNTYVRLLVWNRIPRKDEDSNKCDWLGGHVTLQVKHGEDSAQIGWWPEYWNLAGSRNEQPGIMTLRGKVDKWLQEWVIFHDGKKTRYATKSEMPSETDPEAFDSFMVRGRQKTSPPTTSINEALPSEVYYLCVKDTEKVLTYAKNFKSNNRQYHTLLNNCATVAAEALRAGGARLPKLPIVSPRILSWLCKKKLACVP